MSSLPRVAWLILPVLLAPAARAQFELAPSGDGSVIRWEAGGPVVHTTRHEVRDLRAVRVTPGGAAIATWTEASGGRAQDWYAISLDGKAVQSRTLNLYLGFHHRFVAGEAIDIHHQLLAFEGGYHFELLGGGQCTRRHSLADRRRWRAMILPAVAEGRKRHGKQSDCNNLSHGNTPRACCKRDIAAARATR